MSNLQGARPGAAPMAVSRENIEAVLTRVRPFLQADGGDIELVAVRGNNATVRLTGVCKDCASAHMTLYMGVEQALRQAMSEFGRLEVV
jgi:Fe-S cluster biogenesis protein NfuA